MARYSNADVRERATKWRDSWWTVFLVDPLAVPLTSLTASYTPITPNQITLASLAVGLTASWFFWTGTASALIIGALLYHVSFLLDCMDGKIARLKGTGTRLGPWLDYVFDRVRVFITSIALMGGQFRRTDDATFLYLAVLIVFLDMLRYLDALKVGKIRRNMQDEIDDARTAAGLPARAKRPDRADLGDDIDLVAPERALDPAEVSKALQRRFERRYPLYVRARDKLIDLRVRPHLFSGIEFQMFIFILGPITGQVKPFVFASAALMLVFEVVLIYKLQLSMAEKDQVLAKLAAKAGERPGDPDAPHAAEGG